MTFGMRACLGFAVVLLLAAGASAFADCATQAFSKACTNCEFTGQDIDGGCKDSYQAKGIACVGTSHPVMFAEYNLGMCPALQKCVDGLTSCTGRACSGSARRNCESAACMACYPVADGCASRASYDCSENDNCGNKKCQADKGETRETCCKDCGCPTGQECKAGGCAAKGEAQTGDNSEGPWDDPILDLLDPYGCIPLLMLPFSMLGAALALAFRV
jgi:hypothetical protein